MKFTKACRVLLQQAEDMSVRAELLTRAGDQRQAREASDAARRFYERAECLAFLGFSNHALSAKNIERIFGRASVEVLESGGARQLTLEPLPFES